MAHGDMCYAKPSKKSDLGCSMKSAGLKKNKYRLYTLREIERAGILLVRSLTPVILKYWVRLAVM